MQTPISRPPLLDSRLSLAPLPRALSLLCSWVPGPPLVPLFGGAEVCAPTVLRGTEETGTTSIHHFAPQSSCADPGRGGGTLFGSRYSSKPFKFFLLHPAADVRFPPKLTPIPAAHDTHPNCAAACGGTYRRGPLQAGVRGEAQTVDSNLGPLNLGSRRLPRPRGPTHPGSAAGPLISGAALWGLCSLLLLPSLRGRRPPPPPC